MTETATLEAQLRRFTAFSQLEPELLGWLARNVRLFQAPVGHELLAREVLPDHCFGILRAVLVCSTMTQVYVVP